MEKDYINNTCAVGTSDDIDSGCAAVNALILDYYKKFGRKRDLEQYFSLSTAQSEIKDTSGLFWRKMKSENDSSDSGGRKSDSSHEVCRISIRCSLPEPSSSQEDDAKTKTESPHSESPPIIIEEIPADVTRHTDDESINFDDNNSQRSFDAMLDLSTHKPLSPTSSITSQRKLEWDSLADVGYANESDRKMSASSLSTLERLALKQQYSNNDSKQDIGQPTSHSTPLDENDSKNKGKKGVGKKTTKIYKKDIDVVEVNVPHTSDANQAPSINVNLTKCISFNVEKDGGITIDNVRRNVNVSPEKVAIEPVPISHLGMDKEIQTTLTKDKSLTKDNSGNLDDTPKPTDLNSQKIPVMISLNTLRKRLRRKKSRVSRRRMKTKKKSETKDVTPQEKSGEQVSEAESFEYMPGHMYNQNQIKENESRPDNSTVDNKSSLESSGPMTDSSKGSKHSLTKDLEKCIDVLKITLQQRYDDGSTKKQLIKDIVRRLVNSRYRDDESTTEFLSGLSFNSRKLDLKGNTTSSTSDANNTEDDKQKRPRKSILRTDKFNANVVASTSQSAPNLFTASTEKVNLKTQSSHTESDASSRGKASSDNGFAKTSSEELYLKYLEALRREEAYKRHLKDKEMFLKQKLVSSDTAFKVPLRQESKISSRLKDLMKDLTRNNYDDGSGDASKLEGGSSTNADFDRFNALRNQRSHSVFTLSSSHSEGTKRPNLKKKMQAERELGEAGPSRNHYCCCPHHYIDSKVGYTDSSVQVNIKYQCDDGGLNETPCQPKPKMCEIMPIDCKKCKPSSPRNMARVVPDNVTGEIKYVCMCSGRQISTSDVGDNFMIYKCSRLMNRGVQLEEPKRVFNTAVQCRHMCKVSRDDNIELIQPPHKAESFIASSSSDNTSKKYSKSSQADMLINMMRQNEADNNYGPCSDGKKLCGTSTKILSPRRKIYTVHEATRSLQTEISIDPRIADPTLSDISIVNECDCAKLVTEQVRQVSKTSSEKSDNGKSVSEGYMTSLSEKIIPDNNTLKEERKCCGNKVDTKASPTIEPRSAVGKNYTVPIEGTDMTLTVNLGAMQVCKKEKVSQAVATDKLDLADEATSINEECTKAAQCSSCFVDLNSNTIPPKSPTKTFNSPRPIGALRLAGIVPKSNTYPKNLPVVKEKPPLKRAATDNGALSICSCIQTDPIKIKDDSNNNQDEIVSKDYNLVTKPPTCESGCQVENVPKDNSLKKEEVKTFVGLSEPAPNIGKPTKPVQDKKDVAIQKGLSDDETLPSIGTRFKDYRSTSPPKSPKQNIGTETKTRTDGSCVGCQTDKREKVKDVSPPTWDGMVMGISNRNRKDVEEDGEEEIKLKSPINKESDTGNENKDPIVDLIQDITRRYSKNDIVKIKKKKCFTEIMTVLNYLLDTEDSTDLEPKACCSTSTDTKSSSKKKGPKSSAGECCSDKFIDKSVQLSCRKSAKDSRVPTESSDLPCSSDLPTTSTDSAACKVLKKIRKECEKYHQRRCKTGRKCEVSSSTSINCEKCKKVHHCPCKNHKCKRSKTYEKLQKRCIAYNLIIQTSESMLSEEAVCDNKCRQLKNIIVKVPKRKEGQKAKSPPCSPRYNKHRSKSCPNESESTDDFIRHTQQATVREYLEQNRPDFVEKTTQRQHCLKFVSQRRTEESSPRLKMVVMHQPRCMGKVAANPVFCGGVRYKTCETVAVEPCIPYGPCDPVDSCVPCRPDTVEQICKSCDAVEPCLPCPPCKSCDMNFCNLCIDPCSLHNEIQKLASERDAHRHLLSLHLEQQPDLTNLSSDELRKLAQQIGLDLRQKKTAPKFISEREMKKHSEKIYKTLPEVVQKKEEKKKENIKKTNLLMANIFKKNLQKKTLSGTVNLSNYSTVIKI